VVGASVVGYLKSVTVTDGAATTYADPDLSDRTGVVGPFATFTDGAGNTWTINRSATGKQFTIVDQPMFVYDGVDDYMLIADHADLNFDVGDSLTLMLVERKFNTITTDTHLWSKRGAAPTKGYYLQAVATMWTHIATLYDGSAVAQDVGAAGSAGVTNVLAMVRNVADDDLEIFRNGVGSGSPTPDTTTVTLANPNPINIGRYNGGSQYHRGQIIGVALWREALTDTEVLEAVDWLTDDLSGSAAVSAVTVITGSGSKQATASAAVSEVSGISASGQKTLPTATVIPASITVTSVPGRV
jgi:hypothetical protein